MTWRRLLLIAPPVVVLVLLGLARRSPAVPQPVAFNHRKHTQDLQLNCEFCHQYVTSGAHAGLPGNDICSTCHLAPMGESKEAARLTELLSRGDSLQFHKLFRLPSHVTYTHRRHVGIAQLECSLCHGGIAATERPPARPLVQINMGFCLDCHRDRAQSLDCVACHR